MSQKKADGSECVIGYASRVLSKPERRYCVTRKELLAAVSFIKHFRPYLLGKPFILRTDHCSLTLLYNFKNPEGQLAHWLEALQEYNFTIEHHKGQLRGMQMPCHDGLVLNVEGTVIPMSTQGKPSWHSLNSRLQFQHSLMMISRSYNWQIPTFDLCFVQKRQMNSQTLMLLKDKV